MFTTTRLYQERLKAAQIETRLLDLRVRGLKYSENQPRDDAGRFGSGGGGATYPAPDTSNAGIQDATSAWTGVHYADVRSYMRDGHVRPGMTPEEDPIHGISNERAAQAASTLTAAISDGTAAPDLYRGINVDDDAYAQFSALKPGDTHDMSITSWSASGDEAAKFSEREGFVGDDVTGHYTSHPVMLRTSGARGFDMTSHSFYPQEKEWLTDGQFTVEKVGTEAGRLTIDLRQQAVFATPDQLAGTKAAKVEKVDVRKAKFTRWLERLLDGPLHKPTPPEKRRGN